LASPGVAPLSTAMQGAGLTASQANLLAVEALRSGVNIQDPRMFATLVQIAGATAANNVPNTQMTLDQNGSGISVRALAQIEAGVAFGLPLLPTLLDVGIAFKMIYNEASFASRSIAQLSNGKIGSSIVDDFKSNRIGSSDFNMDLGARFMPLEWLTLSLSARNLIPMDIPVGGFAGGTYHQDPIVRFGAMGMALGFIRVGMDIDLTEQASFDLSGYAVRRFGTGVEFDLPALIGFPLMVIPRVGYTDNLAMSGETGWITGGLAIKIFAFTLDLGAQMALDQAQFKAASSFSGSAAKSYPAGGSVGVTLAVDLPF
jgi:hypothetical protein